MTPPTTTPYGTPYGTPYTDCFPMACPASTHALWRHATDVTVRGLASAGATSPWERQRGIGAGPSSGNGDQGVHRAEFVRSSFHHSIIRLFDHSSHRHPARRGRSTAQHSTVHRAAPRSARSIRVRQWFSSRARVCTVPYCMYVCVGCRVLRIVSGTAEEGHVIDKNLGRSRADRRRGSSETTSSTVAKMFSSP
jgi:hypothetical protein